MNKLLFLFILLLNISCSAKTIRVMVIDTGVQYNTQPEISSHIKEEFDENYQDDYGHGTSIAGLVLKDTCSEVELISCKYYYPWKKDHINDSNECFHRALDEDIQYINYSSYGEKPDKEEKALIRKLTDKGIIVVVSSGNDGKNLTSTGKCEGSYPACYLYENLYIVQNIYEDGRFAKSSNYLTAKNARSEIGSGVPVLLNNGGKGTMSGTSPATAKYTNSLLLKKCWELSK